MRVPSLDGLRAVSVGIVIWGHSIGYSKQVPPFLTHIGHNFFLEK